MKKRILALLLAGVMALGLASCGGGGGTTGDDVKTYNVGVAIYEFNDNFMTLYRNELESYFKTLETDKVKYKVTTVDGKTDPATQTQQIDTFITQQMDVIILNLVQTSTAEALINKIVGANIPLVLINREPAIEGAEDESYPGIVDNAKVCYVGADARQSGTYQGEIVAALDNKGDMNGDGVVKYVMIQGDPENSDAQYRTQYSIQALTDAGIKVEELVNNFGNWQTDKGNEIADSALAQYGTDIDVIFCNNDAMAIGAAQAIKKNNRTVGTDILLLGVDALDDCVEMVKKGEMTGTVLNNHIGQSHKAVDVAVDLLNGKDVENYYWVDYVKVDAEYVNK